MSDWYIRKTQKYIKPDFKAYPVISQEQYIQNYRTCYDLDDCDPRSLSCKNRGYVSSHGQTVNVERKPAAPNKEGVPVDSDNGCLPVYTLHV